MLMRSNSILTALLAIVILTGCGSSAPHVVATQAATGSGPVELEIKNLSNDAIYFINMCPASEARWGEDLLESETLQVNESFTIRNITPGYWNIRIVDGTGLYLDVFNNYLEPGGFYGIDVSADGWYSP